MRTLLTLILILCLALAGCTEDPQTTPETDDQDDMGDHDDGDMDGPGDHDKGDKGDGDDGDDSDGDDNDGQSKFAPSIALTSDVDQGQVPFNATLIINATDGDDDPLNWTVMLGDTEVAAGDGGQANVTVSITEVGVHNFTAFVSDGNATANATISITGTAGEPEYNGPAPLVYSGDTTGFDPFTSQDAGCWWTYEVAPTGAGYNMNGDRSGWFYVIKDPTKYVVEFYDSENVGNTGGGAGGEVPSGSFYIDICATSDAVPSASYEVTVYPPGHPESPA